MVYKTKKSLFCSGVINFLRTISWKAVSRSDLLIILFQKNKIVKNLKIEMNLEKLQVERFERRKKKKKKKREDITNYMTTTNLKNSS